MSDKVKMKVWAKDVKAYMSKNSLSNDKTTKEHKRIVHAIHYALNGLIFGMGRANGCSDECRCANCVVYRDKFLKKIDLLSMGKRLPIEDGFSEYVEKSEIEHYENIRGGEDE